MITKLQNTVKGGVFTILLMFIQMSLTAQTAGTGITIRLQNPVNVASNIFEYDLVLINSGTTTVGLRGYSAGINYTSGMANGGTLSHTFISRGSNLSTLPTVSPGITAATNHLRVTTTNATAGNEVTIALGDTVRIATMRVTNTVNFPVDFNPAFNLQVVTAPGKTACVATCIVAGTSYAINGTANSPAAGTLQALTGLVSTPCFFLNPSGTFAAANSATTPVACFNGSNGSAQITLSSTGSTGTGTSGTYTINGGLAQPYSGLPIIVNGLAGGTYTINVTTSYGCTDTAVATISTPSSSLTSSFTATSCDSYTLPWSTVVTTSGVYTHTYTTVPAGCDSIVTANITINLSTSSTTTQTSCDNYTWAVSSLTYTTSGNYTFTSLNAQGCVHTSTLNLTITNSTSNTTAATACNSYTWAVSGLTYTTGGTYTFTSLNGVGCIHTEILNLTINNSSSSTTTVSTSGAYTWSANSVTYVASGVYTATLINASGCDSILTLNLTITGASFTLNIFEDLPISCAGSNDAAAQALVIGTGTYTFNIDGGAFTNTTGYFNNLTPGSHTICATDGVFTVCDTISFVAPLPLNIAFVIDSTVSCLGNDGQISAIVTGGTTNLQSYLTLWTNSNVPPDTINNQLTNNFDLTISNLPIGVYNLKIEDDNGCFLTGSVTLGLTPAVAITASNTAINCNGGSSVISASATGGLGIKTITIGGLPLASTYSAGTYTITATDEKGCTATSVLNITEPLALGSSSTITNCNSYVWPANSATYTNTGIYTATVVSSTSCDSIVTLNLTINNASVNAPQSVIACTSYTWAVNGVTYTNSGIKVATYTNAAGCDSSYTLNLTINSNTSSVTSVTAPNTYTWTVNGVTYTTSGVYTATSINSGGCIQTSTLNLTINSVAFAVGITIDQDISCFGFNDGSIQAIASGLGGPYTYILDGGVAVNATGFFANLTPGSHTVCALSGLTIACDTVFLTEPAPLAASFVVDSVVSCQGNDGMLSINISGGTNVLQGYLTWWTNAAGDTLNDILTDNFALSVDSLPVGPYTVVIEDDHGCFLTATGNMIAALPISVTATFPPILCFGGSTSITPNATGGVPYSPLTYLINGLPVASTYLPGNYTITATDAKGCTGTTAITITQPSVPLTSSVSITACNFYTWPASTLTYTNSGTYTATLLSTNLCDSVVTLNLTINSSSVNAPVNITACNSYTWGVNGLSYNASGVYTASFLNSSNCDSSYTLNLTINNSTINTPSNVSVCNTYSWSVNGTTYTNSGTYTATFLNAAGCDSNYVLNLIINTPSVNTPSVVTACNSYTWLASGLTYSNSGIYTASFLNSNNCDSIVTLNLTINNSSTNPPTNLTVCNSYTWPVNGLVYTASGSYLATFLNAAGCDSNRVLNITVNQSSVNTPTIVSVCNAYTWTVSGLTYTNTGIYSVAFTNSDNCDSTVTLNLTINQNTINAPQTINACVNYTWPVNSVTYTSTGIYTSTFLNSNGCDSSYTLNLTINPIPVVSANAAPPTVCTNSVVTLTGSSTSVGITYSWSSGVIDGVPFSVASTTTYTVTGSDGIGCSSTSQVTVTVTPASGDIVNTTAGNATSVAGTQCETVAQPDGSVVSYHDVSCRLIATIQDAVGGTSLGSVDACATVLAAVPVYNSQPYFARYYTINASNNGAANVTLYLTQDDFDDYNANAGSFPQISASATSGTATLCISQVPQTTLPGAPGPNTTVHSVTATWNASAARWEVTFPVASIVGGYYFHACNPLNVPLPVTITRFDGHKSVSTDILEWTTSMEQNNAYFNLQHSTDGISFTTLAKVNSKAVGGNSSFNLNYSAENMHPALGHNYYRLEQVDLDGNKSYESHIVDLIWATDGNSVSIYPNPTSNILNIDLFAENEARTKIKVLDMSGRTIKQILVNNTKGMNSIKVDISELAAGIYTVQIFEDATLSFVQKVKKTN
ncbi:MAG: T9SS type A sorting domain-containing protein [Bacteroidetes bacterium]|nr:T9SS type A sorting domain-containing protein [Bacteroidota bacterium]